MRIVSAEKDRFIEIALSDYFAENYPSACLEISISNGNFAGANWEIWVGDDDIRAFLLALDALNQTRKGTACLRGMTESQFEICIEPVDSLGHFQVRFVLERQEGYAQSTRTNRLTGSFDLDSEYLSQTLLEIRNLFATRARS